MIIKLSILLVCSLAISVALGKQVNQDSNNDTPTKVNLPTIDDSKESTDMQTASDTSNSKAVNTTKGSKPTSETSTKTTEGSESTMDLTKKTTTPMMTTNLTTLTTTPMTTQQTIMMMETSTESQMTTTTMASTTEMTTEDITEMTTRFTPAIRRSTTPATGGSNFLSKIPFLGTFAKGLGIKIKGCRCRLFICSCCTSAKLDMLGGDVCMNVYYDPYDFQLGLKLTFDDFPLYERSITGKNIPARCLPVKIPIDILDGTEFCIRAFNIFTPPQRRAAHACIAVQMQIPDFPAIEVQLACVEAGLKGIRFVSFDDHEYTEDKKKFKKSQRLFDEDADPKGMLKIF